MTPSEDSVLTLKVKKLHPDARGPTMRRTFIVNFSFGLHSWAAAKLCVRRHGPENTVLLFGDTRYEDEDTYRWGRAAALNVGARLVEVADGRDIWQVFRDERYLGNTRKDPCSKLLKRELLDRWVKDNGYTPDNSVRVYGIHWSESERFDRIRDRLAPWPCWAPLCEPPLLGEAEIHEWAQAEGLWVQKLYQLGFPHANCGGRCVKMGQAGWALLLRTMPERYMEEERKEEGFRSWIGKDVSILRDRRGGRTRPMTLREFRLRLESGADYDRTDVGGCNCFSGPQEGGEV